jgi:hypothetical protein
MWANSKPMSRLVICLHVIALAAATAFAGRNWTDVRAALCRRLETPPVIDGKLDDPAWRNLGPLGDFAGPGGQPGDPPARLWIAHDDDNLYVALRCAEPRMEAVKAELTGVDADVFEEECAVVLLDPGHDARSRQFVELAANLLATKHDAFNNDHEWNGTWRAAVQRGPDWWTMEMAIPFSDLRARPAVGDLWGLQVGRYHNLDGEQRVFSWSPPGDGFWNPESFGHVVFDSLKQNLTRDVKRLEQRMAADRAEVARAIAQLGPYQPDARALMAVPAAVAEVKQRLAAGIASPDDWREPKAAISRAERDYEDALWNLRLAQLFAD